MEEELEKLLPFCTWQTSLIFKAFYFQNPWVVKPQNSRT